MAFQLFPSFSFAQESVGPKQAEWSKEKTDALIDTLIGETLVSEEDYSMARAKAIREKAYADYIALTRRHNYTKYDEYALNVINKKRRIVFYR